MTIIGISGNAGSGKDTVADVLVETCGFVKLSLADPMKRFCRDVLGFTDDQLWGSSEHRNEPVAHLGGLTARHALQTLGTEWGRACHEDMWIRHALGVARALLFPTLEGDAPWRYSSRLGLHIGEEWTPAVRGVVIPDIRFPNELQAIREEGGKLVRKRSGMRGLTGEAGRHASETEQETIPDSAFDVVMGHAATLDELRRNVLALPFVTPRVTVAGRHKPYRSAV